MSDKVELSMRAALAGSNQLRTFLSISEDDYVRGDVWGVSSARDYFMYSVLDDLYATGFEMMRWADIDISVDPPCVEPRDVRDNRLLTEAFATESALWQRKLIEALATLICFSDSGSDDQYRHWLLLQELRSLAGQRITEIEYFACESQSLLQRLTTSFGHAQNLETRISSTDSWYAQDKLPVAPNTLKPQRLLRSFAQVLKRAVPKATDQERLLLGLSYQLFSETSQMIHFSTGASQEASVSRTISGAIGHCGLLAVAILRRIMRILQVEPGGVCGTLLSTPFELPSVLQTRLAGKAVTIGDFALVDGWWLVRIEAATQSAIGYHSNRVRYLVEVPHGASATDSVISPRVSLLYSSENLLAKCRVLLGQHPSPPAGQPSSDDLERTVVECWNIGLRSSARAEYAESSRLETTSKVTC